MRIDVSPEGAQLAEGDEQKGGGDEQRAEPEGQPRPPPYVGETGPGRPAAQRTQRHEHHRRQRRAPEDDLRRREPVQRVLDEEVGRPPEGRQEAEQRRVARAHEPLVAAVSFLSGFFSGLESDDEESEDFFSEEPFPSDEEPEPELFSFASFSRWRFFVP